MSDAKNSKKTNSARDVDNNQKSDVDLDISKRNTEIRRSSVSNDEINTDTNAIKKHRYSDANAAADNNAASSSSSAAHSDATEGGGHADTDTDAAAAAGDAHNLVKQRIASSKNINRVTINR